MDDSLTQEFPMLRGQYLEQYRIEKEIGPPREGYPTHIYLATDTRHEDRQVALKVLTVSQARQTAGQAALYRFIREADIMQKLNNPYVLPIIDICSNVRKFWIVMPYCTYGTLAEYLLKRNQVPLPTREACEYAIQMCYALEAAHTQAPPIIHRDIKPHNMLFNDDHQLVLADFGIAHIMYEPHLTRYNKSVGTPEYMAPEQLRTRGDGETEGESIDQRLDIYALGCVLYQMLSGQPPFVGNTPEAVGMAQLRQPPRPLFWRNKYVNKGLTLIVNTALEKEPNARFPTAAAFAAALMPFTEL